MEKAEIKRIGKFLSDVFEGICEQDEPHIQQMQLNELYQVIRTLMDETFKAKYQIMYAATFVCCCLWIGSLAFSVG